MARPKGTSNIMRTPKEKEKIIKEYLKSGLGYRVIARKHNISDSVLRKWIKAYNENGLDGLVSKTGKGSTGRPKNSNSKIEQLEQEILKLRIENERLKKGYLVKGDGAKKEYITSLEKNTK